MERWPNFFIVGAPKAGTTSLYEYLKDVPGIFMSPVKEPNYFSISTIGKKHPVKPIRDKKKYLKLFEHGKNSKYIGEASTTYLDDPEAPKLIHEVNPKSKIIICIRDPVERAYSHYLMIKENKRTDLIFHEQLKREFSKTLDINLPNLRLQVGFYSKWIKRYWDIFGPKQVKIIIFEEFIVNPLNTLEAILKFFELKSILTDFSPEVYNPYRIIKGPVAQKIRQSKIAHTLSNKIFSKSQRKFLNEKLIFAKKTKPLIDEKSRDKLINYYDQDVQILETVLKRKLPWKNFVGEQS